MLKYLIDYKEVSAGTDSEEHKYFIPTDLIEEQFSLNFGVHCLSLIPFPGHSLCTIIIKINEQHMHIADELMFSIDGKPLLPSTDPNCIKDTSNPETNTFFILYAISGFKRVACGLREFKQNCVSEILRKIGQAPSHKSIV